MGLLIKARNWLIKKLAGKATILVNATMVDGTVYAATGEDNFFCRYHFHNVDVWCDGHLLMSREHPLPFGTGTLSSTLYEPHDKGAA